MVRRLSWRTASSRRRQSEGQVLVEWLLLCATVAAVAYLFVTKLVSGPTQAGLEAVRGGLGNVVRNGKFLNGAEAEFGSGQHPGASTRGKRLP